jgi:hypothetical protein
MLGMVVFSFSSTVCGWGRDKTALEYWVICNFLVIFDMSNKIIPQTFVYINFQMVFLEQKIVSA